VNSVSAASGPRTRAPRARISLRLAIVIFALINLNVIFVVLLIFLVTRNVFKILLDRRRNLLGAKLRSRLVLIFICFSLIPTMLLFIAATNITTTSIKSWIGGRVGQALTGAIESDANTLPAIIQEMLLTTSSERQGRVIDHDQSASMEKKKQEGYF